MIVISSALQAASSTLRYPRIGYDNRCFDLSASDVTASTESTNAPKDAPLRDDTSEYWEPTATPATWELDLRAAFNVDYVGIGAHTIGSSSCSVLVEVSDGTLGSPASDKVWATLGALTSPSDDSPLLFLDVTHSSIRYVRLTLTDSSPTETPRIGPVYVGQITEFESQIGIAGGFSPPNLSRDTTLHASLSRGGQFLGQGFKRKGLVATVTVAGMTPAWYRSTFDPFVKQARNRPYFFAWNPSDFPDDVVFGWTDKDIKPAYMGTDPFFVASWDLRGLGYD